MRIHSFGQMIRISALAGAVALTIGLLGARAAKPVAAKPAEPTIVTQCKADLAKRLKIPAAQIKVPVKQAVTWPDAALGIPEPGKFYAQQITPGLRLILDARGRRYVYTAGSKTFRYGGPLATWVYSALYLQSVPNEANLNGDLYQCSLIGTNSLKIASGVTDYYPQEKGIVILKRRTSRSGHDLLYIKAGDKSEPKPLYSAFDFGEAAFNTAGDTWAAFVRRSVLAEWVIVVQGVGKSPSTLQTLPLPDGVKPGRIAWSGDYIMVLGKKGDAYNACYQILPKAAKPEWKPAQMHLFPGLPDFLLNKSQSLEISQINQNGKPAVEVAEVWFTGDRDVNATIPDMTLVGCDLLGGTFAFVWGQKSGVPASYVVDIGTDEVIPGLRGYRMIRPFQYPVIQSPITLGK